MIAVTLEISFLIFYYMVSWIFGLGFIDGIMFFIISAFFYGMAFYDFALERDQAGVFGTLGFAFSKPLSMLLTGAIFLIIYSIPVIGIPLPFLSYGGSSLWSFTILLFILLKFDSNRMGII